MKINWKEPWDKLYSSPKYFEKQLSKEISKDHVLFEIKYKCIARRYDKDIFLFQLENYKYKFAVIKLAFSNTQHKDKKYPITKFYIDKTDFINNCMLIDNSFF